MSPQQQFLVQNFAQLIVPFLRNLFKNEQYDDEEAGELTVQESSYRALSALVDIAGSPAHSWLTEFISLNIAQPEWTARKAAVLAFGALAESQDNDQVRQLIFTALTVPTPTQSLLFS